MTYYKTLEIEPSAKLIEIKKAYRRLALQTHPDRNNGSAESAERFKCIGEAYEVLSDPVTRREYDANLRINTLSTSSAEFGQTQSSPWSTHRRHNNRTTNHFERFDDLFRNDPFFQEAFRDLDDEFVQRFNKSPSDSSTSMGASSKFNGNSSQHKSDQGWGVWLLNKFGIDFQMTTTTSVGGNVSRSTYQSKASSRGGTHSSATSSYTSKKSRSYIENGETITIRSMERDGNRIEDKFVNNILIEKKVNGSIVEVNDERIGI